MDRTGSRENPISANLRAEGMEKKGFNRVSFKA